MTIKTDRLELIALPLAQLDWWINDLARLEQSLNVSYRAEPMEGMFRDIVAGQLEKTRADGARYMWHSFWLMVRLSDRVVVGSADFKGPPDERGEVEIGYGLGREFERKGYMTEAVLAMCDWARRQEGVKYVIAETEPDNVASGRILRRCGFTEASRGETVWWKL